MATVNPTVERLPDQDAILYTWVLTQANADGAPITAHEFGDRTVQITGTFDGSTIVIEGANVGTYTTLTDPQGGGISKNAAAIELVMEVPRFVRPNSSGGGVSQSVTVTMFCRRTRK